MLEEQRLAYSVPSFKKDYKEKPGNFRTVILISVVGELLESVLRDKIYMHLERQELIGDN